MLAAATKATRSPPIPTWICTVRKAARSARQDFATCYCLAQTKRHHAITNWAQPEIKRVRPAGFSDLPLAAIRTWADLRMVDPSIKSTKCAPNLCYADIPGKANRSAYGIAAICTLRNWLNWVPCGWPQARAEPHRARITRPALVINTKADARVWPFDAQRTHDAREY